jgi:glyoxylase-like metal-dependent hydrolase (beta-lactamase superfamily II)
METSNFKITQITTKCLSQFAYFIESQGECAVIDPLRDTAEIEALIESSKCTLKYIILTHFHADYVAGHFDLKKKFGTSVYIGKTANSIPNVTNKNKNLTLTDGPNGRQLQIQVRIVLLTFLGNSGSHSRVFMHPPLRKPD